MAKNTKDNVLIFMSLKLRTHVTTMREYRFEHLPPELKETVKKTPPVRLKPLWKARMGIFFMHLFMPKVDGNGVKVTNFKIPRPKTNGGALKLRLYEPEAEQPYKRLGMVFMHWGGFVLGNLETEHARCVRLCRDENIVILSVAYRLAPEHPFPEGLEDCQFALGWLHKNASRLKIDGDYIGVGGTSAGGGLAAGLAIKNLRLGTYKICYQYLGFPVLDAGCSTKSANLHTDTPNWTSDANRLMWGYYLKDGVVNEEASPLMAKNLGGLPETYLWTAEFDPLHDEAVAFSEKLDAQDVPLTFHDYDGCIHGFDSILNPVGVIKKAYQDQHLFFEQLYKGLNKEH